MEEGSYSTGSLEEPWYKRQWWSRIGIAIFLLAFLLIFIAYVSPDWIQANFARAPPESTFRKLGLWMSCYTNLHDPYYYDPYLTSGYEGCRWIYYPVVSRFGDLRDFLLPSFIVPVQITFTLCFITVMALFFMILVYIFRYDVEKPGTLPFLIVIGMLLQGAGLLGTVSVIVFGGLSSSRTWAYEWQFNDLSWAFTLAVIGSVLLHLAGIFFIVEACVLYRKRKRKGEGRGVMYPITTRTQPGFTEELKQKFSGRRKGDEEQEGQGKPKEFMSRLSTLVGGLPARIRESFAGEGEKYPQRTYSAAPPRDDTYRQGAGHPLGLIEERERSISPSVEEDRDREIHRERTIPIQREMPSSSEESLQEEFLPPPPPLPTPPTPDRDIPSESLEKMLRMQERPDSGIGMPSPLPPEPPPPSPPKQIITSSLMGKFQGKPEPLKKPRRNGKIPPPQISPEEQQAREGIIHFEEPPRVRRPSGNGASQRRRVHPQDSLHLQRRPHQEPLSISITSLQREPVPPPLPTTPPPLRRGMGDETLLSIKPIHGRSRSPTSVTLTSSEIPPPPPLSDYEPATLPVRDYKPRSRTPIAFADERGSRERVPLSPSPTRRTQLLEREPGITSYQDFLYTSSHVTEETTHTTRGPSHTSIPPPPVVRDDDYGLPSPEEYFAEKKPKKPAHSPPPPTAAAKETTPSSAREPPRSAAEAVAEILASRQPVSLRIHIQKHKTETSYKKSQTFSPPGNKGKNGSGSDFSESSI